MLQDLLGRAHHHLSQGELESALAAADEAAAAFPGVPEVHNAKGVVLRAASRLDEAETSYRHVLSLDPGHARAHNNLADLLKLKGRYEEAIDLARRALQLDHRMVHAYKNMAQCFHALGELEKASAVLQEAIKVAPGDSSLLLYFAKVEHDREAWATATAAYRKYLEAQPGDAEARADLGAVLSARNRDLEAIEEFRRALDLDPDSAPAQFGFRESIAKLVPAWHIPMMNEPLRNSAYRDAIRSMVRDQDHVLEIGTGAGLLALLSAEAGARKVTTCEMVPLVAERAAEVIGRSRHAAKIKLVAKRSADLDPALDLGEKADLLVSEILANDFVGEGVLPSLIDAKKRLLKPEARIIPRRGALRGVLVGGPHFEYLLDLGDVCGFDMRPFAALRPWRQSIPQRVDYDALSAEMDLLVYDFETVGSLQPVDMRIAVTATGRGRCYGILQWIRIELAPGIHYENHPLSTESVWNKVLYAFPEPMDVEAGDEVVIRVWQRDDYLYLTRG